jgi:hypothetical protein
MILLGIVASGLCWYTIGSMALVFTYPKPAKDSPRGDGIMMDGKDAVMLLGEEGAVMSVTRGRFSLKFDDPGISPEYRRIGICSTLLLIQSIAQLLLIPQGTLFGQIMFLSTVAISWAYNSYLSSIDGETIRRELLVESVWRNLTVKRFQFGTRASLTVFALLAAQCTQEQTVKLLDCLIPNNTAVWIGWKEWVLREVELAASRSQAPFGDGSILEAQHPETAEEEFLLVLTEDARSAYRAFLENRMSLATPLISFT